MALNKPKLTADIIRAFEEASRAKTPDRGIQILATKISAAVDEFVKSGEVQTDTIAQGTVDPGILTSATVTPLPGVPPPPAGPANGPIIGIPLPSGRVSTGIIETTTTGRCSTKGKGVGKII